MFKLTQELLRLQIILDHVPLDGGSLARVPIFVHEVQHYLEFVLFLAGLDVYLEETGQFSD